MTRIYPTKSSKFRSNRLKMKSIYNNIDAVPLYRMKRLGMTTQQGTASRE